MQKSETKTLTYFLDHPSGVSLDPLQSDYSGNGMVFKHLVGTLVRYANGGQFEPYLAESWEVSEDKKHWKFKLRRNLQCEDGERITPFGYREGLQIQLRSYAAQGAMPIMSDLAGWSQFLGGSTLNGVRVSDDDTVEFVFERAVGGGFLEYLSMSYYGYFCGSNFKNGKWASDRYVSSSGPYRLMGEIDNRNEVMLKLRSDFGLSPSEAPQTVRYITSTRVQDIWKAEHRIIQKNLSWNAPEPSGFVRVLGPPDNVRSIVLDRGPSGFFGSLANRLAFRTKLVARIKSREFKEKSATLAESFYAGAAITRMDIAPTVLEVQKTKLLVLAPAITSDELKFVSDIVTDTLDEMGLQYEVVRPGEGSPIKPMDFAKRDKFDIRIPNVIAGSVIEPWVVEMMFCSDLGVSFPDPSNRVCNIIKKVMSSDSAPNLERAAIDVSQAVYDDAAVIPVFHGRTAWYFSNDLDLTNLAGDIILPSFDDVRYR